MGKLVLTRVDSRMVHGQVASGWAGKSDASKIVVVDTETSSNEMMKDILMLAVPVGMDFDVLSEEEAIHLYKENQFGLGTIMLIFRTIETAKQCYDAGIKYDSLQLGGTGIRENAQIIEGPITITESEYHIIEELVGQGVDVYLQQTVQSKSTKWNDAKKKIKY